MNFCPESVKKIYMMAICGTGMGSLAGLLKEQGYDVSGSDNNVYPPMSDQLSNQNIPIFSPFSEENLINEKPDLVIVGNAITKSNPEAVYLLEQGNIPYISMPQALKHFFLKDKDVIVVSGTHGKTTTTTLMTFLLEKLGESPSYLIGGVSKDLGSSFHYNPESRFFVIEGDEYDTAFFDKGPKFLHYNPKHVIITSLEFDHADIYRDLAHIQESFTKLFALIPQDGCLHYCEEYQSIKDILSHCNAPTKAYNETLFPEAQKNNPMSGKFNALNLAAAFSVLESLGLDLDLAAKEIKNFKGIKRRQDILFEDERLTVIDDFAHHPTAVKQTIQAIKEKYPHRNLIAIFEPRSNTSIRSIFQDEYTESFSHADEVLLPPVFQKKTQKIDKTLNVQKMVESLKNLGKRASFCQNTQEIIDHVVRKSQKPAVALIMSNGGFEGIHTRLIETWQNNHE